MHTQTFSTTKGFTLVELSIVLVIIGLIIGGVLVGQDLIKAAEVRSQMRQIEEIDTALNTFRLKFNALPGDYNAAVANLGATAGAGTGNGDGDSVLEDADGVTNGYGDQGNAEMLGFWHHLGLSGLLSGGGSGSGTAVGTTWPKAKIGTLGIAAYFSTSMNGRHFYQIGKSDGDLTTFANAFSPAQASELDQKIDNGIPNSGRVVARGAGTLDLGPSGAAAGNATHCVTGDATPSLATNYNTAVGVGGSTAVGVGSICGLRITMAF